MTARFDLMTAPLSGGTVLLEASAGTGKTYTLVGLLLRQLVEKEIEHIGQALIVTFTVAATEELKNRVRQTLLQTLAAVHRSDDDPIIAALARKPDAERILRRALDDFDQVSIATIHGFCKRLLDESAFESREPFALDFVADALPYLHNAAADALRSLYTPEVSTQAALLQLARFDPQSLVRLYRLWQRYPDVGLEPAQPDLETHCAAVRDAVDVAAGRLDQDACEVIEKLNWGSGKSLAPVASRYSTERLLQRLEADALLALPELIAFSHNRLDKNLKRTGRPPLTHEFFRACDAVESAATTAQAHLRAALLQRMHARLEEAKLADHALDFQDLLSRTHTALHDGERKAVLLAAIRTRYRTALIDEFQDTDRLQYEIFATCFHERPLFLIGDPKQSIYGFRGADLEAYDDARRDATDRFTLATNYRTSSKLVDAVQHTCGQPGAFLSDSIDLPDVTAKAGADELLLGDDDAPPLQWRFVGIDGLDTRGGMLSAGDSETRIAKDVAAEISRLLRSDTRRDDRPLRPGDIAVLCRTNAQATLVQDHLRAAGVISAIGKAGDVFATEELQELIRLLLAVLQPRNLQACRAAMTTRIYGLDATALNDLDEDAFNGKLFCFEQWRHIWVRRGFFAMKERMLADLDTTARLLVLRSGERRLTNLQQLCELLHHAEHDNRLSPEGLLDWLHHERIHHEEIDYQLRELRLESDDDAVQVLTVHGSKGLEYDVVFCPYLWHAREARGDAVVETGNGRDLVFSMYNDHQHKPRAEVARLAEDVRLTYVALTRARRRCYVHIGPMGKVHLSALCWLLAPLPPAEQRDVEGDRDGQWLSNWAAAIKNEPSRIAESVDRLVEAYPSLMTRVDVAAAPDPETVVPPPAPAIGPPRRAVREPRVRGLFSFSSLIAGTDHEPVARDTRDPAKPPRTETVPQGIFAFARGPAAGNCLHTVLEYHDWDGADDAKLTKLVRNTLSDCGLADRSAHRGDIDPCAVVVANVGDLAAALVAPRGPSYGELCGGQSSPEWHFTLPAADSPIHQLARCFADSDSEVARRYAPRLSSRPPRIMRGFLTGFVDVVAEHDGRYWVVDYKSNHLGNDVADYGHAALAEAMHDHDYVLQYHLYALAVHRMLRQRLVDYDYDRHFGGIGYVFLRGVVRGDTNGTFFDRPPAALIESMDGWAAGHLKGQP